MLSSPATGEHDNATLVATAWTWRQNADVAQHVHAWQGEFASPRALFQRLDEETLLAHVVFADESMRYVLCFNALLPARGADRQRAAGTD